MQIISALAATGVLLLGAPAHAEPWQAAIGSELVRTVGDKWVVEHYNICALKTPGAKQSSLQIRSYAEAPTSVGISRDFMLSFATMCETLTLLGVGAASASKGSENLLEALECHPITSPIGKVDIEFNIFMTGEGFQLEVVSTAKNETVRESKRWAEVFPEN